MDTKKRKMTANENKAKASKPTAKKDATGKTKTASPKKAKPRKPRSVTWEEFQEAVIGLDASRVAVIMTIGCDWGAEVVYDCDLRGPNGTVIISGFFETDDDGKIVSIEQPNIDGTLYSQDDYEIVYARLLRRFQGELVFVPKGSPSIWF